MADETPALTPESVQTMIDTAVADLNTRVVERDKKIADLEVALGKANEETSRIIANRDSILREKRELEGRKAPPNPDSSEPTAADFVITREEARDPQAYRRMKEKAAKAGFEVTFSDNPQSYGRMPDRFDGDTMIYVSNTSVREGGTEFYQKLKAEAAEAGKRLIIATDPTQFPKEAFDAA